jgi:aerobic carbon-monoxide dehydrogenase large subunit
MIRSDWNNFENRQDAARKRGKLRGIGCGLSIERAGGCRNPRIRNDRTHNPDRSFRTRICDHTSRNRRAGACSPVLVHRLDGTAQLTTDGTDGSRSAMAHGEAALVAAQQQVLCKAKSPAAEDPEVKVEDLEYAGGIFWGPKVPMLRLL